MQAGPRCHLGGQSSFPLEAQHFPVLRRTQSQHLLPQLLCLCQIIGLIPWRMQSLFPVAIGQGLLPFQGPAMPPQPVDEAMPRQPDQKRPQMNGIGEPPARLAEACATNQPKPTGQYPQNRTGGAEPGTDAAAPPCAGKACRPGKPSRRPGHRRWSISPAGSQADWYSWIHLRAEIGGLAQRAQTRDEATPVPASGGFQGEPCGQQPGRKAHPVQDVRYPALHRQNRFHQGLNRILQGGRAEGYSSHEQSLFLGHGRHLIWYSGFLRAWERTVLPWPRHSVAPLAIPADVRLISSLPGRRITRELSRGSSGETSVEGLEGGTLQTGISSCENRLDRSSIEGRRQTHVGTDRTGRKGVPVTAHRGKRGVFGLSSETWSREKWTSAPWKGNRRPSLPSPILPSGEEKLTFPEEKGDLPEEGGRPRRITV